ncbi:MAG: type IV pilus assembly protein PilC [Lysobacterales bacterium]
MPTFKYVAKNQESKTVQGKISADNKEAVIEELRKRSLTIVKCEEEKSSFGSKQISFGEKKVKTEDIVIFTRQLATMVDAGIPILQGLNALAEQTTHPTFKKTLTTIETDIKNGSSLSAAFAKHKKVFSSLFINLVKVGETGGVLNVVLERISGYLEKSMKLTRKVKAALTYPIVVVSMAGLITFVLMVKVVPTFTTIYDSFDSALPPMTQLLINISDLLKHHTLAIIGVCIAIFFAVKRIHKTHKGARVLDGFVLRMPVFGDLIRKVAVSRFSRTLSTLIQSGVPILESLDIVEKTIGNTVLEDVIVEVKNSVREGDTIAAPLERSGVFPVMVTRMIAIGEKSGQMEKMLLKISEFYDDQVDAAVEGITSIIEPLIIGVLGVVIGFIVIALFLPIMNLTALI